MSKREARIKEGFEAGLYGLEEVRAKLSGLAMEQKRLEGQLAPPKTAMADPGELLARARQIAKNPDPQLLRESGLGIWLFVDKRAELRRI